MVFETEGDEVRGRVGFIARCKVMESLDVMNLKFSGCAATRPAALVAVSPLDPLTNRRPPAPVGIWMRVPGIAAVFVVGVRDAREDTAFHRAVSDIRLAGRGLKDFAARLAGFHHALHVNRMGASHGAISGDSRPWRELLATCRARAVRNHPAFPTTELGAIGARTPDTKFSAACRARHHDRPVMRSEFAVLAAGRRRDVVDANPSNRAADCAGEHPARTIPVSHSLVDNLGIRLAFHAVSIRQPEGVVK